MLGKIHGTTRGDVSGMHGTKTVFVVPSEKHDMHVTEWAYKVVSVAIFTSLVSPSELSRGSVTVGNYSNQSTDP